MNLKLVFISILVYAVCGQQAILFTSSLGFYNMRQNSNMVIIYHHLKIGELKMKIYWFYSLRLNNKKYSVILCSLDFDKKIDETL